MLRQLQFIHDLNKNSNKKRSRIFLYKFISLKNVFLIIFSISFSSKKNKTKIINTTFKKISSLYINEIIFKL